MAKERNSPRCNRGRARIRGPLPTLIASHRKHLGFPEHRSMHGLSICLDFARQKLTMRERERGGRFASCRPPLRSLACWLEVVRERGGDRVGGNRPPPRPARRKRLTDGLITHFRRFGSRFVSGFFR